MNKILILDFGSQYTQLIARRVREEKVYCEIQPFNSKIDFDDMDIKGVILSGSPYSSLEEDAPVIDIEKISSHFPVLAVCYSAQYIISKSGGVVKKSNVREYGRAKLNVVSSSILSGLKDNANVWMSHSDSILEVGNGFDIIAKTDNGIIAGFQSKENIYKNTVLGVQFHPEVTHTEVGKEVISLFLDKICKVNHDWTPISYIETTVKEIKETVGDDNVILGLSGGVDSSVAAYLIDRAIGKQLTCIFIDNGLLRKNEFNDVLDSYKKTGLNVIGVDSKKEFYTELDGISDPESKRKTIGRVFVEVFEKEAKKLNNVKFLAQGTIYPDVIESVSVKGPSATIKSHHNVGGLPEKMGFKLLEPLKLLFKDEVRNIGAELGVPREILMRHPFPGPGLGIRILGDVTEEKVNLLQEADDIYMNILKETGWYEKSWQSGTILLPINSVGVMGDERTYEQVVSLRCVHSTDGMTADWVHIPYDILARISNEIINKVSGINRVVYDISSKPPATIEWE